MPYNGASNGSGVGGAVAGSSVTGGGATIVVSEGPQNKKIRTGVQQPGENDVNMHARVSDRKKIDFKKIYNIIIAWAYRSYSI